MYIADTTSFRQLPQAKGISAISGSGGAYISNQIFYRVAYLRSTLNPTLPNVHFHIPRAKEYLDANDPYPANSMPIKDIMSEIEQLIKLAIDLH